MRISGRAWLSVMGIAALCFIGVAGSVAPASAATAAGHPRTSPRW
jgi:hypothetical protein